MLFYVKMTALIFFIFINQAALQDMLIVDFT